MSTRGPRVPLSGEEQHKIVRLLRETDLTMTAIAQRLQRSKNVVITVNRKHRIRAGGRAGSSLHSE